MFYVSIIFQKKPLQVYPYSSILTTIFTCNHINGRFQAYMKHSIKQNSCVLAFFKKDLNCSPLHLRVSGGSEKIFRYFGGI